MKSVTAERYQCDPRDSDLLTTADAMTLLRRRDGCCFGHRAPFGYQLCLDCPTVIAAAPESVLTTIQRQRSIYPNGDSETLGRNHRDTGTSTTLAQSAARSSIGLRLIVRSRIPLHQLNVSVRNCPQFRSAGPVPEQIISANAVIAQGATAMATERVECDFSWHGVSFSGLSMPDVERLLMTLNHPTASRPGPAARSRRRS